MPIPTTVPDLLGETIPIIERAAVVRNAEVQEQRITGTF